MRFDEVPLFDGVPHPASTRVLSDESRIPAACRSLQALLSDQPAATGAVLADPGRRLRRMVKLLTKRDHEGLLRPALPT